MISHGVSWDCLQISSRNYRISRMIWWTSSKLIKLQVLKRQCLTSGKKPSFVFQELHRGNTWSWRSIFLWVPKAKLLNIRSSTHSPSKIWTYWLHTVIVNVNSIICLSKNESGNFRGKTALCYPKQHRLALSIKFLPPGYFCLRWLLKQDCLKSCRSICPTHF